MELKTIEDVRDYIKRAAANAEKDPPDSEHQRGYMHALEELGGIISKPSPPPHRQLALDELAASMKRRDPVPPVDAVMALIGDALGSLDRIASAVERIAAANGGHE